MTARALRVLAFAGSLRRESLNRSLLRAAKELAPPDMAIEIFDLIDVPLYNGDVEAAGDPAPVAAFKQAVRSADAVLISTPEYNHGLPAVTKNAVDWLSRPPGVPPLNGKPVGILGASPGIVGTARAQDQLRQVLCNTASMCLPHPEVLVFKAHEKFDATGKLTDEKTREHLSKQLAALAAWTRRFVA